MNALNIILSEHQSLAAVLHGMLYLVRQTRDRGTKPDFLVLGAMLHYIDTVPERFHHPKEDKYLFARLRERRPETAPLLDRLHGEHIVGAEKIRALEQSLLRYQHGGGDEARHAFTDAAEAYAGFHWDHMRREENEVLPLAQEYLEPADWLIIDEAFAGHTDPLLGAPAKAEHDKLFTRIVNLAPAPIGVGPAS
ncbi:MAG: hemerythrin domain-containing protein [Casimicrobiaceae bacterium]